MNVEAGWTVYIDDYAYKFGNFFMTEMYFILWNMLIQLVITSLLKGFVWEIFSVVDDTEVQYQRKKENTQRINHMRRVALNDGG